MRNDEHEARRRRFLRNSGMVSVGLALPGWRMGTAVAAQALPTPSCPAAGQATPHQMEGPFFKPRSPKRVSLLESGLRGTAIAVSGRVLTTGCRPIAGALLDFWQCDADGDYNNQGYRLRGHQFSDEAGGYRLDTIVPGLYPGRTRHIHVKVQAPGGPILTTQLYFPDEPTNASDLLFRSQLLLAAVHDDGETKTCRFDFVLKAS